MKTTLYVDPDGDHKRIAELHEGRAAYQAKFPGAQPGQFSYQGERWEESVYGFGITVYHTIREIPLFLKEVPINTIILEDTVEDPNGLNRLTLGIFEEGGARAESDSFMYHPFEGQGPSYVIYKITVEGTDLTAINTLYAKIRQSQASPAQPWDLVAPTEQ